MAAELLKGKPVADLILKEVKERAEKFKVSAGRPPHLSVVLVGNDPASALYTEKKGQAAVKLGMSHETIVLPSDVSYEKLKGLVSELNQRQDVDGILIQRPLPQSFPEHSVVYWVLPEKDVDAFHPINAGRLSLGLPCLQPCTPSGIMEMLKFYKISAAGKIACVVGRSSIVGNPMSTLLLKADATLFQCHSRTTDLSSVTSQADILVVAAGKRHLIGAKHVKKGAVVIDVGIHRTEDGRVVGDVRTEEVGTVASAVTPVPGGVGPMTIALLMRNTLQAAEWREKISQ